MSIRNGIEETDGIIIGGEYVVWELYYDGRRQTSHRHPADNDAEAIAAAKVKRNELRDKFKGFPCYLYPDDDKWEVRIW